MLTFGLPDADEKIFLVPIENRRQRQQNERKSVVTSKGQDPVRRYMKPYHREIEKVAFELYEKSGRTEGHDLDHWLEAERIVSARQTEKKVSAKAVERKAPSARAVPTRAGKPAR
jgi:hypothetical protein